MDIGTVAAHNIALAIGAADEHVETIRNAIRDEIQAMSSHFTLAVADLGTQYEAEVEKLKQEKDDFITAAQARETQMVNAFKAEVAKIKSTFTYVEANPGRVAVVLAAVIALGVVLGHFFG
ncbi:MAG TPA: hypothetical protein VGU20_31170 [Stellaceae bacterium]|nr:hypothetical protein [Stellaceae bacterium]